MNKILAFMWSCILCVGVADAAVRDATSAGRNTSDTSATTTRTSQSATNTSRAATNRQTTSQKTQSVRGATMRLTNRTTPTPARTTTTRAATVTTRTPTSRGTTSRAAAAPTNVAQTRTGAAYEQCKTAYFTCMDQFCALKNDDYRRCSCSARIFDLENQRDSLQQAGEQLTIFTENLDVVGMTAAQATAMHTASDGENALTSDTSASKALLQAIMNSIRGEDANVGGKYSELNSINISFDTVNAFGITDTGQVISTYNGQNLYSAVYPQCRDVVRADCNDASLQRAINAYLMAIEQDCNTVQTAIDEKKKQTKSAIREGSAMLDLARVENRREHNSSDIATCINNVEAAILSEEVCGTDYHKCLDNGEFIDITTGKPIAGVERFYELEKLLTFADGVDAANQKLSSVNANRTFVQTFESRTKKFAQPALDKCTEQADVVWSEYLDKALLSIYYAQKSKVSEIKQGCFDFVSSCYMNGDASLTDAMAQLSSTSTIVLQPDKISLSTEMCRDYINSCNYMFDGDIVAQYIENRKDTDRLTACRAVVKQCFDNFGGQNYENFYYPYSGSFKEGYAADWFSLYEIDGKTGEKTYKSECAKQLSKIASCNDEEMMTQAFGGLDRVSHISRGTAEIGGFNTEIYYKNPNADADDTMIKYGLLSETTTKIDETTNVTTLQHRTLRPTGVATELYNNVLDILSTQCMNLQGRFIEYQRINTNAYKEDNFCVSQFAAQTSTVVTDNDKLANPYLKFYSLYRVTKGENMCPRDYALNVDTQSWGACLCWENGARRSKWGTSPKCVAAIPIGEDGEETTTATTTTTNSCTVDTDGKITNEEAFSMQLSDAWCIVPNSYISSNNQVCINGVDTGGAYCNDDADRQLPLGLK